MKLAIRRELFFIGNEMVYRIILANKSCIFLGMVLLVYVIAAWFNTGYYHPDEHYQLIEFAGLKLGLNNESNLAWEYSSMIRPTFQVWICWLILIFFDVIGIVDPYILSFGLRLITAFLVIFGICLFYSRSKKGLSKKNHLIYALLSFFIWFIPSISVRFSSETWSGILFMIGFSFLFERETNNKRDRYLGGIFMGMSFLCRFQIGFMIIGLILWLILVKKESLYKLGNVIICMLLVIFGGVLLDFLFYGEYVITFWNYYKVNILEGVSSEYGIAPWWTILVYIIDRPIVPIGLLIILSYIIVVIMDSKSPVLWCTLPFLMIHAFIPHKELRFLFPLVWLIPYIIIHAINKAFILKRNFTLKFRKLIKPVVIIIVGLLGGLNAMALHLSITQPAGYGHRYLTKRIRDDFKERPVKIIHTLTGNPFEPWPMLKENFYREENISYQMIERWNDLENHVFINSDTTYLLGVRQLDGFNTSFVPIDSLEFKQLYAVNSSAYTYEIMVDKRENPFIVSLICKNHE